MNKKDDRNDKFKEDFKELINSELCKNASDITKTEFKLALHLRHQLVK